MTDWAARIIDPEAFDGSLTCGITFVRQELARTKARAIVETAREITDEMIERAARVHAPMAFAVDADGDYCFDEDCRIETCEEVRAILEAALNSPEQT